MARPRKNPDKPTDPAMDIIPSIRNNDDKHILEEIFNTAPEEMPEIKSVGFAKIGTSPNSWVSYTLTTKGDRIIKMEVEEPNMRVIAEESSKIAFVSCFTDSEF